MDPTQWLIVFAVCGVMVVVLFILITGGTRAAFGPHRRLEEELAVEVLHGRLVRGEITQNQFEVAAGIVTGSPRT